jgi:hypothetical protein
VSTKPRPGEPVPRPTRTSEYVISCATRQAQTGWRDLIATARGAAVTAWEFLTKTPTAESDRCYPLEGALSRVTIDGEDYVRWQYKPTSGARIWYAVIKTKSGKAAGQVLLERVSTGHPVETLKNHR